MGVRELQNFGDFSVERACQVVNHGFSVESNLHTSEAQFSGLEIYRHDGGMDADNELRRGCLLDKTLPGMKLTLTVDCVVWSRAWFESVARSDCSVKRLVIGNVAAKCISGKDATDILGKTMTRSAWTLAGTSFHRPHCLANSDKLLTLTISQPSWPSPAARPFHRRHLHLIDRFVLHRRPRPLHHTHLRLQDFISTRQPTWRCQT